LLREKGETILKAQRKLKKLVSCLIMKLFDNSSFFKALLDGLDVEIIAGLGSFVCHLFSDDQIGLIGNDSFFM
jgi:hypothetical protein